MADISKIQLSDDTQYNLKDAVARSLLTANDTSAGDISKIQLSDNTQYNIKDAQAREDIETITTDVKAQVNADKDLINGGDNFIDDETLDDYDDKIAEMQEAYKKFIPIQTTSGTEIQLDNSSNDKALINIGLDGNTEQDGEPTPDIPVEVKTVTGDNTINIVGRNINSTTTRTGLYQISNGTYSAYPGGGYITLGDLIPLGYNKTITVSNEKSKSGTWYILEYDKDKNYLNQNQQATSVTSATFTTQNPLTKYIAIDLGGSITLENAGEIMIELGSIASTYEPYQSQSYPINLASKNYCDGILEAGGIATSTGVNEDLANRIRTKNMCKIPSEQITISVKETDLSVSIRCYDNSKAYLGVAFSGWGTLPNTFTPLTNTRYIRFVFKKTNDSSITVNSVTEIQVESGSTATTYEPFWQIELAKISTYKDYIKRSTGKNLFDGQFRQGTAGVLDNTARIFCTNGVYVEANKTYTFSTNMDVSTYNYFFALSQTQYPSLTIDTLTSWINTSTYTITPTNSGYLGISIKKGDAVFAPSEVSGYWFQLEENTSSTSPEPYGKGKWYKYNAIKKSNLGSDITFSSTTGGFYSATATDYATSGNTPYCEWYKGIANVAAIGGLSDKEIAFNTSSSPYPRLYLKDSNYSSNTTLNSDLSANQVYIYYALATPTITEITDETLISQLEAVKLLSGTQNNFTIDADTLPTLNLNYIDEASPHL